MGHSSRRPESRRSFVARLPAVAGGLATLVPAAAASGAAAPAGSWDLRWLDAMRGRHRQVFSVGVLQGGVALDIVTNWLDAHEEVFGLRHPDVNALVGIANRAFPINASDAIWARYELGRRYDVTDPDTNAPARRNVFLHGTRNALGKLAGVEPLQARGAIFWQCNNALTGIASSFARSTGQPPAAVREELIAGLNPGVRLVPAHTMLLGLAQEHRCTYESIGG